MAKNTFTKARKIKLIATAIFASLIIGSLVAAFIFFKGPILEAIELKSIEPIQTAFKDLGILGPILSGIILIMTMFTFVVPVTIIQAVSMLAYGNLVGFLTCLGAIIIGNSILYFVVNKLNKTLEASYTDEEKAINEKLDKISTSKKVSFSIFLLYFVPGISVGLVASLGVRAKFKYPKFLLISTIGNVINLLYVMLFGLTITQDQLVLALILIIVYIILFIILFIFRKKIITKILNPKKDTEYYRTNNRRMRKLLYYPLVTFVKIFIFKRYKVKVKKLNFKKIKGPFVVLFNHPSPLDAAYAYAELGIKNRPSTLIASYYYTNIKIAKFFYHMGGISKHLYAPDLGAAKKALRAAKQGWPIGLAPEGRLSAYGSLETITEATPKFLKKLNLPLVFVNIKGAYLTKPKWASNFRRGKIDVTYELMYENFDLNQLSDEELLNTVIEKLSYDDFAWQEENKVYYKGKKFANGLENILYHCPVCNSEFTLEMNDHDITCTKCHIKINLDNYYQFNSDNPKVPKNIRDWYLLQKDLASKAIKDPHFKMESKTVFKLPDPKGKGFKTVGEGKVILDKTGLKYVGTNDNQPFEKFFELHSVPVILFGAGVDIEFYRDNTIYFFELENLKECAKYSIYWEALYNEYIGEKKDEWKTDDRKTVSPN